MARRTTQDELIAMESDRAMVDKLFTRLMIESVQHWCEIAEERLRGSGVRCFIDAGNDDEPEIVEVLKQASYVEMPEGRVVMIDDEHEMVSSGFANTTPWHAPRDIPEEELAAFIDSMASRLQAPERSAFNLHVPPFASGLDIAPLLTGDLKPIVVGGEIATARWAAKQCAPLSNAASPWCPCMGISTNHEPSIRSGVPPVSILAANMVMATCAAPWST